MTPIENRGQNERGQDLAYVRACARVRSSVNVSDCFSEPASAHVSEWAWCRAGHQGTMYLISLAIGRRCLTGMGHGVGVRGWRAKGRLNLRSSSAGSFSTPGHSYRLLLRTAAESDKDLSQCVSETDSEEQVDREEKSRRKVESRLNDILH